LKNWGREINERFLKWGKGLEDEKKIESISACVTEHCVFKRLTNV